jgi:hypothetical protein
LIHDLRALFAIGRRPREATLRPDPEQPHSPIDTGERCSRGKNRPPTPFPHDAP